MSNLKNWMIKKNKGPIKLSKQLGMDLLQLWTIFSHIRKPKAWEAKRISDFTLGQVSVLDLYKDFEEFQKKTPCQKLKKLRRIPKN